MIKVKIWHSCLLLASAFILNNAHAVQCEFLAPEQESPDGYRATIEITNNTTETINSWNITMGFADGTTINNGTGDRWDAVISGVNPYTAINDSSNGTIAPGDSIEFGFNATKGSANVVAPTFGGDCDVYSLDAARSSLYFVSTKKLDTTEPHTFSTLSGGITGSGDARLIIDLESVVSNLNIPIRNERMREHLFETNTYPTAEVAVDVNWNDINNINVGSFLDESITAFINLHGVVFPITTDVRISKVSATSIMVRNVTPLLIKAGNFGMEAGVDQLKSLASLTSISYAVPTNFTLFYTAQP